MFNFQGKEIRNRFSENKRDQESSQNFSSDSQISPTTHSLDFSASVAQMDRIIHQRMKNQFPDFHLPETSNENMVNELGLCQNFGNMSFGLNPNKGFKDFGSTSSGDFTKLDNDLYKHVIGLREGYSENRLLGSDFYPKNSNPIFGENIYYKNGDGYSLGSGSKNGVPQFDNLSMNKPYLDHDLIWSQSSNMNPLGDFSSSNLLNSSNHGLNMDINPVYNDGSMLYSSRGLSVDSNPVSNGPMSFSCRASSLENSRQDISGFYPNRGLSLENPMYNDSMFYHNRDPSVKNTVFNDPMLYVDRSLGVQNPMCNDLMFNPNRDLSLGNPMNNSPMLYPNQDSSVENMLCNGMVFRDEIRTSLKCRSLNNTGDLGASSYEDSLILDGKSSKKVAEKGQSSHGKGSKGRKKKSYPENVSQNRRGEIMNPNTQSQIHNTSVISETMCGSLFEFRGYIYFIAKDQLGCRFLQRVFDEGRYQDVQIIFNETINHVCELMMDQFANYLIQKLIEVCSDEQLTQILFMVTARQGELVEISMNTHGTRVVQKLIETLKTKQQKRLVVSAVQTSFLELVKNANGYHVIKSCLQYFNKNDTKFMFAAAASCYFEMATHQHGCCILKSCIAQSDGQYREKLATEIASQGFYLAQDAFGNYVVQHIIELKIPSAAAILSCQFRGNYVYLSTQKFSSHVVQAFLNSHEKSRANIIQELISVPRFEQLLQDPFANYVIQTAIDVSKGPLHDLLVKAVRSHSTLRNSPYCKKIFSGNLLKK